MKATGQYFLVAVFLAMEKALITYETLYEMIFLSLVMEFLSVMIRIKAIEQWWVNLPSLQ